ncbi:MAG TPA: ATP-binding protein [Opitutaceae bacterium]|nr:ATP-binding protein [Opitutaceae bacterium]
MSDTPDPSRDSADVNSSLDSAILRLLMNTIPDRIFFKDLQCRIVRNNAAHAGAFGITPGACVGKTDFDFFSREYAERTFAEEQEIIRSGIPLINQVQRIVRRDGTVVWGSTTKMPWRDHDGRIIGTFGLTRDVTATKEAEARLLQEHEELTRSNAELEQFAYVASHDLQEPLRAVASCVQLLKKRYEGKLDARADEFIRHAVEGTKRMQALITDLLAYSRVGTHQQPFEPVDCNAVVDESLANLTVAIQESGATVTRDPLPTVMADPTHLTQVFQNLIGNALKFRAENRPPRIHLTAKNAAGEWTLGVSDNGIGIEPQYFERIFRVFQRLHTRTSYPGTGIGLAICKKIVERHGGRIWIESQFGQGSTFYFTLPERKPPPPAHE